MGLLETPLTIAIIGVIFLAAFLRLWRTPPKIELTVVIPELSARLEMPSEILLSTKHVPADVEVKPTEEPIPAEIIEYISLESEIHAQEVRKRRIRALKADTGSWDTAFRLLQKEDNVEF